MKVYDVNLIISYKSQVPIDDEAEDINVLMGRAILNIQKALPKGAHNFNVDCNCDEIKE